MARTLKEAEEIKKRWQGYTEELYKKDLHDPDNHDGVTTHLEPGILECGSQVGLRKHHYKQSYWRWWNSSWPISNTKRWCCESAALNMPANLENSAVATGLEKVSFIPIPKKGNAKECSNHWTSALISHTSKVMLKILQARLQQYVNHELPNVQAGFRKGRGTRDQIANICCWTIKKVKRVPEKHLLLLFSLCQSPWLCGSQQTVENS